jgi:hypothetical protein
VIWVPWAIRVRVFFPALVHLNTVCLQCYATQISTYWSITSSQTLTFNSYYCTHKFKDEEKGVVFSTLREIKAQTKLCPRNPKEGHCLCYPCVGSSEHGNEPSRSINIWKLLDKLRYVVLNIQFIMYIIINWLIDSFIFPVALSWA